MLESSLEAQENPRKPGHPAIILEVGPKSDFQGAMKVLAQPIGLRMANYAAMDGIPPPSGPLKSRAQR